MLSLPDYFRRVEGDSLIARVYGVFQVQMKGIVPVNFVLQANTIKMQHKSSKLITFDLKGSFINRKVVKGESQTYKD